jgi:hypothetical protein
MTDENYKIEIFIPKEYLEELREVLVKSNAGKHGNYDSCLSYSEVSGSWRPLEGANPFDGEIGVLKTSKELKVEVTCPKKYVKEAIKNIKKVHPYEVPVINIIPLANQYFE